MTCDDCLYYKYCSDQFGETDYFEDENICGDVEDLCGRFEDKSLYIKLPVRIGDTVYEVKEPEHRIKCIRKREFRLSDLENIGKTVFISDDEALKAFDKYYK